MSDKKAVWYTAAIVIAVVAGIGACILLLFGILFTWAAFSPQSEPGWLTIGIVTDVIALVIIALAVGTVVFVRFRRTKDAQQQTIVQQIDLSGEIGMEKLKCRECGAELSQDSVTVKEGAIFISCPYCGSTYQVVEEPKWEKGGELWPGRGFCLDWCSSLSSPLCPALLRLLRRTMAFRWTKRRWTCGCARTGRCG